MLNRPKVIQALNDLSEQLFVNTSVEFDQLYQVWHEIVNDSSFATKAKAIKSPWMLPTWSGDLNTTIPISPLIPSYCVLAVDGSQIYPDRHQGVACYLLNIGSVRLCYGTTHKPVVFDSRPCVMRTYDEDLELEHSSELVNCQREEWELRAGLEYGLQYQKELAGTPFLTLFDGSLIFWHLQAKDEAVREKYLSLYLGLLEQMHKADLPYASYISFPKSKELINLLRIALCNFKVEGCTEHTIVDRFVDTHLVNLFLQPGERTIIFNNHSPIVQRYPEALRPKFFYLHAGQEIARVEIPAWVAADEDKVKMVSSIILDQCTKGRGYPVCLAEAHEQAVVKGADREFFYHLLQKEGIEHKQRYALSQKSLKKRSIGI